MVASGVTTQIRDKLGYDAYNAAMVYGDYNGAKKLRFDKFMEALKAGGPNAQAGAAQQTVASDT